MGHHREHQWREIVGIPMKSAGEGIPCGLQKKTPPRVFFCAQTFDFTGVSEVLGPPKMCSLLWVMKTSFHLVNQPLEFLT